MGGERLREFIPPYRFLIFPRNPFQAFLKSLPVPVPVSEIPGRSRNSQSCDVDFAHVDSLSGFTS